jgi:large subunit ribosomal protein L18
MVTTRNSHRLKRKLRIRAKVVGSAQRPRLSVFRSNTKLRIDLVDDSNGKTITTFIGTGKTKAAATVLGQQFAAWAKEHKVETIVFDRGGYQYHGSIQVLCDAIREGGITV